MSQDFAKRKKTSGRKPTKRKTSARTSSTAGQTRGKSLRLYLSGVLTGIFISFIGYLSTLPGQAGPEQDNATTAPEVAKAPKPSFSFYRLLPEQTLEVEDIVEPAADISSPPPPATQASFLLQAGSFRQREDAERRRAELLLLGLEPRVKESNRDTGMWHRVYLGPFSSHKDMTKARSLTAGQGIDTLVLKRGEP